MAVRAGGGDRRAIELPVRRRRGGRHDQLRHPPGPAGSRRSGHAGLVGLVPRRHAGDGGQRAPGGRRCAPGDPRGCELARRRKRDRRAGTRSLDARGVVAGTGRPHAAPHAGGRVPAGGQSSSLLGHADAPARDRSPVGAAADGGSQLQRRRRLLRTGRALGTLTAGVDAGRARHRAQHGLPLRRAARLPQRRELSPDGRQRRRHPLRHAAAAARPAGLRQPAGVEPRRRAVRVADAMGDGSGCQLQPADALSVVAGGHGGHRAARRRDAGPLPRRARHVDRLHARPHQPAAHAGAVPGEPDRADAFAIAADRPAPRPHRAGRGEPPRGHGHQSRTLRARVHAHHGTCRAELGHHAAGERVCAVQHRGRSAGGHPQHRQLRHAARLRSDHGTAGRDRREVPVARRAPLRHAGRVPHRAAEPRHHRSRQSGTDAAGGAAVLAGHRSDVRLATAGSVEGGGQPGLGGCHAR